MSPIRSRRRTITRWSLLFVILIVGLAALCWFGIWIPNYPSHTAYPVRGIDVSHHQGAIDWALVKKARMDFAYIKATEGSDYIDPTFSRNWSGSAAAEIARGAYHFFTLGTPGELQAANFMAIVPVDSAALPPAIDLEFSGYNVGRSPTRSDFARELAAFFDAVSARYGKSPVIYTTYDFKNRYLGSMPIERLWIRDVFRKPHIGNTSWVFWQFSARGRIRGVATYVDLNVFNRRPEHFRELITGNP